MMFGFVKRKEFYELQTRLLNLELYCMELGNKALGDGFKAAVSIDRGICDIKWPETSLSTPTTDLRVPDKKDPIKPALKKVAKKQAPKCKKK